MFVEKDRFDWESVEKVYFCVCEHPGESSENISRELQLSQEKVNDALDELQESGLVLFKSVRTSPIVKKHYPVEKTILMTPKLKLELKKFLQKN